MNSKADYDEQREFEAEVRRCAEAVWGLSPGGCQPSHYVGDPVLYELDGLVRLPDTTHVIMATVSRRLDKAKDDVRKLEAAEKLEKVAGAPSVAKWFITKNSLEAEHIKHCQSHQVTAITLDQFRRRFFDGRSYLAKRQNAAFGSARNILDNSISVPLDEYVPLPVRRIGESTGRASIGVDESIREIEQALADGQIVVLMAPFGAGKSLTLREIYFRQARDYSEGGTDRTPLAINLRDHWGARYADEVLDRHARVIGFEPRHHLTVAWRAGWTTLLLDGFDELGTNVIAAASNRAFMRAARLEALRGVSALVSESPQGTGILLVGRDHYFDDRGELAHALGLSGRSFLVFELGEFGEAEAEAYLRRKNIRGQLPGWLPRKPLILGYLASAGLLPRILAIDGGRGIASAWDEFLTKICDREAAHAKSDLDAVTLRKLLERLAFDVRCTPSLVGPIGERDLAEAYLQETGQYPTDAALAELQRLPGLTARDQEPGMRSFVDQDLLAALQGGCLARHVLQGTPTWSRRGMHGPLSSGAIAMAAYLLNKNGATGDIALTASSRIAASNSHSEAEPQVAADCLEVAFAMMADDESINCRGLDLEGVYVGRLPLEGFRIEGLTLSSSVIGTVALDEIGTHSSLRLRDCDIGEVQGIGAVEALPRQIFQNCTVSTFDDFSTNAAIIRSDLPPRLKALLTILRKLYAQAGGGRKLGAFRRGIPAGPIQDSIQPVLERIESAGLMFVERGIAHPVRKQTHRVVSILRLGATSADPLVREFR